MIQGMSQNTFKARIVFTTPKTKIKPYIEIQKTQSSKFDFIKTKEPTKFQKLLFGIKKRIKLPSLKEQ